MLDSDIFRWLPSGGGLLARLFLCPLRFRFLSRRLVPSFPLFFFIASPSPMPDNISQLRGFMGHHKDTPCVSVAWWPTRVNFYYGRERLIRARTTRETYPSTRIDLVEDRVFLRMALKRAERQRDVPCRWTTRLPDMRNLDYQAGPLHYLHSEAATSLTNCHYVRRPIVYRSEGTTLPFAVKGPCTTVLSRFHRKIWDGVFCRE